MGWWWFSGLSEPVVFSGTYGQEFEDISYGLVWCGLVLDGKLDSVGGITYEEVMRMP